MEFLDEAEKRRWEDAWRFALMQKLDGKKFPKRPEQIWDPNAAEQSAETMRQIAAMWASNGDTFFKDKAVT